MENPIIIILVIAVLAGVIFFVLRRKKKNAGTPVNESTVLNCINNKEIESFVANNSWRSFKTAKGAQIWSTTDVPQHSLDTIDRAIDFSNKVQAAQFPEWKHGTNHAEVEITFLPPPLAGIAPESKLPFIWHGGVMTAGTVAHCNQTKYAERNGLFLPDFSIVNWERDDDLFWYVFNENEHRREYLNDRAVFAQFVGITDQHPHKHEGKPSPYEFMPRGLMSKPVPRLECGFAKQ